VGNLDVKLELSLIMEEVDNLDESSGDYFELSWIMTDIDNL
jgi:hypothetical protein